METNEETVKPYRRAKRTKAWMKAGNELPLTTSQKATLKRKK